MNRVLLISDRLYLMILILGITMGIETILQAKRIIIAAFTEGKERKGKERILLKVIERGISSSHSATFLYNHGNKLFVLERTSTLRLTRYQASWLLEAQGLKGELQIKYNLSTKKKGVKWLSQKIGKLILRLLQEFMRTIDYQSQLHRLILWDSKFDSIQRVSQYQQQQDGQQMQT
ncbi:unnamed protein product [Paramecium sonneborni]|uniref:Uncharacterized protein n=1 Tax=Paramecium sonneborni TaxID=65129 RepID=A0A8S1QJB6_9CILI|nr:unnamed protein product [Paramecium sonneborni]